MALSDEELKEMTVRLAVFEELLIHITRSLIAEAPDPRAAHKSVFDELRKRFDVNLSDGVPADYFLRKSQELIGVIETQTDP
ncbi:hypothetical protein [Roseibium album]|uniref:hypothetical protein n=1 Tax=Roseibium album TaxID=311410 RepID=UPI002492E2EA|nr:hypothetical protein [Roseibium album]